MAFFKNLKKTTRYTAKHDVYLYGDECLTDAIDGAIHVLREPGAPRYVCFADYDGGEHLDIQGAHDSKAIRSNSAIVMEWNAIMAPKVRAAFADMMWAHILVDTEDGISNRIAAIIPLAKPITDAATYTRTVGLLAKFLDIYHLSEGCWSTPFAIKFQPFAKTEFVNGTVLDAEKFNAKHTGSDNWNDVAKYVGPEPIKKIAMPAFAKDIGKKAAKVQLDMPPGASDMFDGL